MIEARRNYIHHICNWWWGETTTLISGNGCTTVELQIEDNSFVGFVKGLIVFPSMQRNGYATEIMQCVEDVAREKGLKHLQLNANKEEIWLVEWYERLGFVKMFADDHEWTMIKQL